MPFHVKPEEVILRDRLRIADAAAVEAVLRATGAFSDDEVAVALELVSDAIAKGEHSDYRFLIAATADDERVLGYCCYGRIACTVHSFDVYWIAVDPTVQKLGMGRRLLSAAEEHIAAAGGRRIYVETSSRPDYERTRRFYLGCGYAVDCVQQDFYAPDDSKVTLVKVLG